MKQINGRYFEDFQLKEEYTTLGRTITEADVVSWCGLSGDWSEPHSNAEAAKKTMFGERIVHGALVIPICEGLQHRLGLWEDTYMGLLDREWGFSRPIKFGDTLRVKMKIVGKQEAPEYPGCGILAREIAIMNQKDEIVSEGSGRILIRKRGK